MPPVSASVAVRTAAVGNVTVNGPVPDVVIPEIPVTPEIPFSADVIAAARAAYVDRFVQTLPNGYHTRVTDDAAALSAGERQLITIARAILADPRLLVLDEATSSVDTRTEVLIAQAMAELRRDRTSFIIAHRLSTIRDADLIVVMRDGRIIEVGTHTELISRHDAYWEMVNA